MFSESLQVTCLVTEPGDTLEVPEFVLLWLLGCPFPNLLKSGDWGRLGFIYVLFKPVFTKQGLYQVQREEDKPVCGTCMCVCVWHLSSVK